VRDGALASLKLKHVDLAAAKVLQDAREVNIKFSKTFTRVCRTPEELKAWSRNLGCSLASAPDLFDDRLEHLRPRM
jgi:hypothetical protein